MEHFNDIIGHSPALKAILQSAKIAASTDATVLIVGETGTGKEILAAAIHQASPRRNKPFITLNCASLAKGIVESELFGHRKGAFTGAIADKQGIFQTIDGGTLLLDEINSLPLAVQTKLLRFLESGECLAIGSTAPYNVNVRIIASSNANLNELIAAGEFRRDLYYRLNVLSLELPPLRNRREDIETLTEHFIQNFAKEYDVEAPNFSKNALKLLRIYPWPGNLRELRNLCMRLCILLAGKTIEAENLPQEFRYAHRFASAAKALAFILPEGGIDLETLEIELIQQALSRTNGNQSKSARLLGLTRHTLLYRLKKYGLTAMDNASDDQVYAGSATKLPSDPG